MAYINKRTIELLKNLTLTVKVSAKRQNKAEHDSSEWHTLWDESQYAHMAIDAILGEKVIAQQLREAAAVNDVARQVIDRAAYYGVTI